ncbi:MAG: GNAT family N-acetyltransferase [Eubacteriaceae bacterium]|jgi:ribosomal protein S18 acetylase RimI-like enzyme|nr:GNAT family N-acetyltransferase [Eubacteriaceae bacterium]
MEISLAYDSADELRALLAEYIESLLADDASFAEYLDMQNFDAEFQCLESKYGLPYGRLYIARMGGEAAGCIGLRQLSPDSGEMKRLYVKPGFRRQGIARLLVRQILSDAQEIGYSNLLLDTMPSLAPAIRLYESLGFSRTGPYNDSPMETTVFMRRDLPL